MLVDRAEALELTIYNEDNTMGERYRTLGEQVAAQCDNIFQEMSPRTWENI
jgi:hypothetical protein